LPPSMAIRSTCGRNCSASAPNFLTALGQGYPVAGGLSQSAVNDRAGALAAGPGLRIAGAGALPAVFTGLLENLAKAALAAVVLVAISSVFYRPALRHMWRASRLDFYAAAIALGAVLLLGIRQGVLLAAAASILMLLARTSRPHVAFLGRVPGTNSYSDLARHRENEPLSGVIAFRPEASLIYINTEAAFETVLNRVRAAGSADIRTVVCDISASPYLDLAGSRMRGARDRRNRTEQKIELPPWIGEEVTANPRYGNSTLARSPIGSDAIADR
jgi:SulP family sulfate permease